MEVHRLLTQNGVHAVEYEPGTWAASMAHTPSNNSTLYSYSGYGDGYNQQMGYEDWDYAVNRERLRERLAGYGLSEVELPGDGTCQFAAISDQLFSTPKHHRYAIEEISAVSDGW